MKTSTTSWFSGGFKASFQPFAKELQAIGETVKILNSVGVARLRLRCQTNAFRMRTWASSRKRCHWAAMKANFT